jgi:hypothetical protein
MHYEDYGRMALGIPPGNRLVVVPREDSGNSYRYDSLQIAQRRFGREKVAGSPRKEMEQGCAGRRVGTRNVSANPKVTTAAMLTAALQDPAIRDEQPLHLGEFQMPAGLLISPHKMC